MTRSGVPDPPRVSFWDASPHLQRLCRRKLSDTAWTWAEPQFRAMGERAAIEVAPLSMIADRESPRRVDGRVEYHDAYRQMQRIAYGSGMIAMKYNSGLSTQDSALDVFIAFNGDVRPGEFIPIGAGNVRYRALGAIVRAGDVFVALRDRSNLKGRCRRCEYNEECSGSRARAFAMTGDLFASDPLCIYEEE